MATKNKKTGDKPTSEELAIDNLAASHYPGHEGTGGETVDTRECGDEDQKVCVLPDPLRIDVHSVQEVVSNEISDHVAKVTDAIYNSAASLDTGIGGAASTINTGIGHAAATIKNEIGSAASGIEAEVGNVASALNSGVRDSIADLTRELGRGITVRHDRTAPRETSDLALWVVIRKSANALSFTNYADFMDAALCGLDEDGNPISLTPRQDNVYQRLRERRFLPFNDTDAYRLLKVATEAFLLVNSGIPPVTTLQSPPLPPIVPPQSKFNAEDLRSLNERMGGTGFDQTDIQAFWDAYSLETIGSNRPLLPYLALIRQKLKDEPLKEQMFRFEALKDIAGDKLERCVGILRRKLVNPIFLELIWSYWHEEGMLVQTMNAIARRFQNVRNPYGSRDPLANLEIDPLRPLNNLLWGYVQDEQHRLSIVRRVYEYDHHYGITLQGKAVPKLYTADSRSKFIEAFHHLLYLSSIFFKQDDDTTVISDGFPILNALREIHLILSQGAHNQFGDLPSTARQEMLLQQWLLARPEFREFLPTRVMVAYSEPWMDRVDAMKALQGWTDVSVDHFNRLAVFGEQILLSIRFGAWSDIGQTSTAAANWARFWRAEIQGYIHDYRAVTGVDLTASSKVDSTPPSVHLFNRYMAQTRR